MKKHLTLAGTVLVAALVCGGILWLQSKNDAASPVQEEGTGAIQHVDDPAGLQRTQNLPVQAALLDQVVVPVPSEVFAVLDKIGRPHWKQLIRATDQVAHPRSDAERTALVFGYMIAEGFIAVEARDSVKVKELGKNILNLAGAIGVRKEVVRRSRAIERAADRGDWLTAQREFEGAILDVKEVMRKSNSITTADLVSLGGWLRGTDALVTVIQGNYTSDLSELLYQPGLVDHFSSRISSLPTHSRELPVMSSLQQGLAGIRPLMGSGSEPISKEAVDKIGQVTSNLVRLIEER